MVSQLAVKKDDYDFHALAWEDSKVSQKSYCETNSLNYGYFVAARSKIQAGRGKTRRALDNKPSLFTELKPKLANCQVDSQIVTLQLPSGSKLLFPADLEKEQLSNWMSAMVNIS